ncbi:Shedu immune nuclease family protein [Devosia naphthalenivorans]|uniref:Shedu immune nuclease family protein n=1 Tax=Devosia naphthalenivorans TaxID=2082392 RepID=UPI000D3827D7|nr:Shedu immune nuclease family protein [Devosia naphthalenivorans]
MSADVEYLQNYKTETLYIHPGANGAYATLLADGETLLHEIEVTDRARLAVSAFFVNDKADFGTFKLTKLKFHKTRGWYADGQVQVNHFGLARIRELVSILSALNLADSRKTKIALGEVQLDALATLLGSSKGTELMRELSGSTDLHHDIYAVAHKRKSLTQFKTLLDADATEPEWQEFFEANRWIFGHGLNYVFLDGVQSKLEAVTTGASFDHAGKRTDALLRTRAEVSQYVLVEIKRSTTPLLQLKPYRSGCWSVGHELSDAVTQIQKTTFDFARNRFRDQMRDAAGTHLDDFVYSIEPKSYLVVGNLAQIADNSDKIACFELYRRNTRSPEILTFDELFYRARCIVENVSQAASDDTL